MLTKTAKFARASNEIERVAVGGNLSAGLFESPPATYDLKEIETRTTELIEQGLPPIIRPIALGLAWAINPRDVSEFSGFLAPPPPPPPGSYKFKLEQLAKAVAEQLAPLARIPAEEMEHFEGYYRELLSEWIEGVTDQQPSQFTKCLDETRHNAAALYRSIESLREHHQELSTKLRYVPVHFILKILASLNEHLDEARNAESRRGGKSKGRNQYPRLDTLIQDLEFFARLAGGKGFGSPDKKLKKGRLIQAIDWLRSFLETSADWKHRPQFLPPLGRHPLSAYEAAVARARADMAEDPDDPELLPENSGKDFGDHDT
jgi:hypothetical protein